MKPVGAKIKFGRKVDGADIIGSALILADKSAARISQGILGNGTRLDLNLGSLHQADAQTGGDGEPVRAGGPRLVNQTLKVLTFDQGDMRRRCAERIGEPRRQIRHSVVVRSGGATTADEKDRQMSLIPKHLMRPLSRNPNRRGQQAAQFFYKRRSESNPYFLIPIFIFHAHENFS